MDFLKKVVENSNQGRGEGQGQAQNFQGQQQHQGSGSGNNQDVGSFISGLANKVNAQGGEGQGSGGGSFFNKLASQVNTAAGGGRESEKDEDYLDKGVDFVQEKFLGKGPQDNESAIEQAKDEKISDFIREKYKSTTGSELPIKDKPTRFD